MPPDESSRPQLIDATERWFRRRGLPYSGLHDVSPVVLFNRVLPVLLVTLLAELITMTLSGRYDGWALDGVFLAAWSGLALIVGGLTLRHPRRAWKLPRWASLVLLVGFVTSPALIALGFESAGSIVVVLLLINLGVLVLAMLLEYYNVLPIVRHEISEIRSGQRKFFPPMRQVLPILLVALLFLFMTAEIWQVAHDMTGLAYATVIVALIGFSAGSVVVQTRERLDGVEHFGSWQEIDDIARSTTAPYLPLSDEPAGAPDLDTDTVGQAEVGFFVFVVVTVQLVVVATVVALALAIFGVLVVRRQTIVQWTELEDADWDPITSLSVVGQEYAFTRETLLMAGLLGVVAAMQFAISIVSDSSFQGDHINGLRDDAREVFAVRARYRRYLSEHRDGPG